MFAFVAFVAFVGSVATSGSGGTCGLVATSGVVSAAGSCVGILSIFIIGNNLLLKLLRTFSLALNNNPNLFKKDFFSSVFIPSSKFFNSLANYFAYYQLFLLINALHVYLLKNNRQ